MLVLSGLITAVVMYGGAQWMRMETDPVNLVSTWGVVVGLTLVAMVLNYSIHQAAFAYCLGAASGIAFGIYADAKWPLASAAESNIWPIAIVLWWGLAAPGTALAIYVVGRMGDRKGCSGSTA
jgi:hypothetical protein